MKLTNAFHGSCVMPLQDECPGTFTYNISRAYEILYDSVYLDIYTNIMNTISNIIENTSSTAK